MEIADFFKEDEEEKNVPLLEEEDIKDFLGLREIKKEDYGMIEKFAEFPKDFFIDFHNFFSIHHSTKYQVHDLKGQIETLESDVGRAVDEKRKNDIEKNIEFKKLLLSFLEKYDPFASIHLVRVFERRKKEEKNM